MMVWRGAVALALTAFVAAPVAVHASGFQLVEQNGSGLGNAYAGQAASVEDASAIYFNPAALTRIPGKQFVIAASGIAVKNNFTDAGSTGPFLPTATRNLPVPVPFGSDGGDPGSFKPVPNAYFSWQAAKQVWVGVGVNAPFGLKTEWDSDWIGRFHAVTSDVKTINVNPTVAFKVNDSLSIGVGASWQQLDAELTQSVAYGGLAAGAAARAGASALVPAILAGFGSAEGRGGIKGDSTAWGWNAGATVKLGEPARLALSYRSRIKHDLAGDATFAGVPNFAALGPVGGALNAAFASGTATAKIELPDTFSAAISYQKDKLEVMADYSWTGWSTIESLDILRVDGSTLSSAPLKFQDIWRVGLGFNYKTGDRSKLRLGTAYDKAPVQDEFRTPRLPDENRIWAAAGFQYQIGKKGAVDLGYAHLFIKDASSNLPNQDTPSSSFTGNLVGTYDGSVNIVSLQYRLSF
jgi:long-chain fatty acid transport protein